MIQVSKLTIKDAELALEACKKKSAEIGVPMDIAITDESGNMLIFHRMDGAVLGSIQVAIDKAYTSAIFGCATGDEGKVAQPGQPDYGANTLLGGRVVIIAGGVPIIHKNTVLGAIGCSSGAPDQDTSVAQAGVTALIKSLS